jgi:hypothetical protein
VGGVWCREIVAVRSRELEKLLGHDGAHDVPTDIVLVGPAAAVTEPTGSGFGRAQLEWPSENVELRYRHCRRRWRMSVFLAGASSASWASCFIMK